MFKKVKKAIIENTKKVLKLKEEGKSIPNDLTSYDIEVEELNEILNCNEDEFDKIIKEEIDSL